MKIQNTVPATFASASSMRQFLGGRSFLSHPGFLRGACLAAFVAMVSSGYSASTWDGGGSDNDFLTAANWNLDTAPTSGTTTVIDFAGSVRPSPVLNSNFEVQNLLFDSGASSFTLGGTGILSVFGAGTGGISFTSGISNNSTTLQTISSALKLTGNAGVYANAGALTLSGTIDGGTSKRLGLRSGNASGRDLLVSGAISGSLTELQLRGSSASKVKISGNNTFSVVTAQILDGNIVLANSNALGGSSNVLLIGNTAVTSAAISVLTEGAVSIAQSMRLTSQGTWTGSYTLGGSDASTSTYSGSIIVNSAAANSAAMPVTVTAASGGRVNFTGGVVRDGSSTGSGDNVTKSGSGVVNFAGTNTYSGTTSVSVGTLLVNGTLSNGGGTVTVSANATLGGTGTINRAVNVLGSGVLSAGDMSGSTSLGGKLTMSSLSLANTSVLAFDLVSPTSLSNDQIAVNGALTLDGILNVASPGTLAFGKYTLFTYTGALTDNTLSIGSISLDAGYSASIDTSVNGVVSLAVIPEPGAVGLLGLAFSVFALARFRRREGREV